MAPAPSQDAALEAVTMRKITLRIVPFLMICYFVAFVDRVNAGFAALQMNKDVGLSASVFGLGGGLFFIAYVICEVPSNLAMEKVGARLWIARIMITWGIVSGMMALVVGPWSFYAVRILLGAAEAGFFPGVILYLTYWFPSEYRGRIVAIFMVAIPLSSFLGSPISASLLQTDGMMGLRGWQWLFILEAVPAVLLGILALVLLPNGPDRARWLAPNERAWLTAKLAAEAARMKPKKHLSLWQALWTKQVLILALVYSGASATSNALSLWQPQILKSYGLTQSANRAAQQHPVRGGVGGDDPVGTALRSQWGARVEHRPAAGGGGDQPAVERPVHVAGADGHHPDAGADRHLRDQGAVLGAVDRVARRHRGRGRASRRSTRWPILARSAGRGCWARSRTRQAVIHWRFCRWSSCPVPGRLPSC